MKTYSYFEAKENYSVILDIALNEDVLIFKRETAPRDGKSSPFDVPGIDTGITAGEIIDFVRESRSKNHEPSEP